MIERITEIQHYHANDEIVAFYRGGKRWPFTDPSMASCIRLAKIARALSRQRGWEFYPFGSCAGWGLRSPELEEQDLTQIDQRWLDERMYTDAADVEPELNKLAEDAERLAQCEHKLIGAIREGKKLLARLPSVIRMLNAQQQGVGQDLAEALEHHDQLSKAHKLLSQQVAEAEVSPQFPFRCNECDGKFMGGRGAMPGDLCPICSFGHIINVDVRG